MHKKVKFCLASISLGLLVVVAAVNVNITYNSGLKSDIGLNNVEALAQSENGGHNDCLGEGNYDCGGGKYKYNADR